MQILVQEVGTLRMSWDLGMHQLLRERKRLPAASRPQGRADSCKPKRCLFSPATGGVSLPSNLSFREVVTRGAGRMWKNQLRNSWTGKAIGSLSATSGCNQGAPPSRKYHTESCAAASEQWKDESHESLNETRQGAKPPCPSPVNYIGD